MKDTQLNNSHRSFNPKCDTVVINKIVQCEAEHTLIIAVT